MNDILLGCGDPIVGGIALCVITHTKRSFVVGGSTQLNVPMGLCWAGSGISTGQAVSGLCGSPTGHAECGPRFGLQVRIQPVSEAIVLEGESSATLNGLVGSRLSGSVCVA